MLIDPSKKIEGQSEEVNTSTILKELGLMSSEPDTSKPGTATEPNPNSDSNSNPAKAGDDDSEPKGPYHKDSRFNRMRNENKELKQRFNDLEAKLNSSSKSLDEDSMYKEWLSKTENPDSAESRKAYQEDISWMSKIFKSQVEKVKSEITTSGSGVDAEVQSAMEEIQDKLDYVKEQYKINTDDKDIRKKIMASLSEISPKDDDGEITQLGDIDAAVKMYNLSVKSSVSAASQANKQNAGFEGSNSQNANGEQQVLTNKSPRKSFWGAF